MLILGLLIAAFVLFAFEAVSARSLVAGGLACAALAACLIHGL